MSGRYAHFYVKISVFPTIWKGLKPDFIHDLAENGPKSFKCQYKPSDNLTVTID